MVRFLLLLAIAGVVSRVGSLERSVEFHEDAILELERQGSVVDSLVAKVEEMDQLLAQLEQLSDLVAEVERDTAVRFWRDEGRRSLRANSSSSRIRWRSYCTSTSLSSRVRRWRWPSLA